MIFKLKNVEHGEPVLVRHLGWVLNYHTSDSMCIYCALTTGNVYVRNETEFYEAYELVNDNPHGVKNEEPKQL